MPTTKAESLGLRNSNHIAFSECVPALRMVRVPCNLIGKLLDNGKATTHALKLLAIKVSKGDGFVLNEVYVRDRYGVNRKPFKSGIRLLKQAGVLDRSQPNHRAYAKERLAGRSENFVVIDEDLLFADSTSLIGFVIAVKISVRPGTPLDFAKRIGVTSRGTAQRLAKQAQQYGCDVFGGTGTQPMLVGRGGTNFELFKKEPAKKEPAKKGPTHSRREKGTEDERRAQKPEKATAYATRNPDGFGGLLFQDDLTEREIVLKNWKASSFWQNRDLNADTAIDMERCRIENWRWYLDAYGGAPDHLKTMHSFRHAAEIATELSASMDGADDMGFIMQALAYWSCKAHADGRKIHSLGFIAEQLARQLDLDDAEWCFAYPSRLADADYRHVYEFARKAVAWAEDHGISVVDHKLLSTQGIEDLADIFRRHSQNAFVISANEMLSEGKKPSEGCSIIRWSWFAENIRVEQPKRGRGRR